MHYLVQKSYKISETSDSFLFRVTYLSLDIFLFLIYKPFRVANPESTKRKHLKKGKRILFCLLCSEMYFQKSKVVDVVMNNV